MYRIRLLVFLSFMAAVSMGMAQADSTKGQHIFQSKALSKGKAFVGGSFGFSTDKKDNTRDIFGADVNSRLDRQYQVDVFGGYFFSNNNAVGLRIGFEDELTELDGGTGTSRLSQNRVSRGIGFSPFLRNYFTLDKSGIFNLFNETKVTVGFGQGVSQTDQSNEITRSYTRFFTTEIGLSPGIAVILNDFVSVEASVDILGLKGEWSKTKYDDRPEEGTTTSTSVDFKLNLLSLNLGLAFYFN